MTKMARLLAVLLISAAIISLGNLAVGVAATHPADSESGNPPAAEAESEASVRCLPFGLYGAVTADVLVSKLSDGSDDLTFVGTSNGLYVVGPNGLLRHFVYSPFGVKHIALIDDITGDGIREVVVALNDTQVPALRCYDGATWEKLWQFAPMTKIWDDLWVQRQLSISGLEVTENGDSQSVVIISGRSVFSLDAKNGQQLWRSGMSSAAKRIAVVADLNSDDTDEVFLATEDGCLRLVNGNTGQVRWRTRLPEITVYSETIQSMAEHILTLDREAGLVAVASTDSSVRLFDLKGKRVEWEISLPTPARASPGPMAPVPNATPDGRPGLLVSYTPLSSGGASELPRATFLDAAGGKLWDTDACGLSLDLGSYGGKPVIMVPKAGEIRLVDLADGESVVKTIPVSTPDEWGTADGESVVNSGPLLRSTPDERGTNVMQIGDDAFLLVGNLTAVSSTGEVVWHYPRIANVKALGGYFVGDATKDTLFSAEWKSTSDYGYVPHVNEDGVTLAGSTYTVIPEAEVRLLKVMDGVTSEIAWSYEVPLSDLKTSGGLKGIEVTADLVGNDGFQDILGYRQDTVFIFSGKDGTPLGFAVGEPITSLDVIRNGPSGNAIAVGTASGLTIFDGTGTPLSTTTGTEWVDDVTAKFMVLDDLNSDNVSDLAVLSSTRIVLLRSIASATAYESHLTFNPETNSLIEYVEVVPDADGDGAKDLVYIQRNPGSQQQNQYAPPGCPVLVKRSPVGGEQLLRVELPSNYPTIDLACGDFNSDGCVDSLICYNSYDTCSGAAPDQRGSSQNYSGYTLRIISGKDGSTIRSREVSLQNYGGSGWNINPPATDIGDVTGDGKDDLAWTGISGSREYSGYRHQQIIEVYDVARDESLQAVPTTSLLREGGWASGGEFATLLPTDIDGDGCSEVLAAVSEPFQITYEYYPGRTSTRYLAVVDIDSSQRLAGFAGFNAATVSLFESHQPGVLGMAAAGGAYFLDTNARLAVTSPADGARTGPMVSVRWEGTSEGEFVQVFVDGVRNYAGNDYGVDLYLARGEHDVVVWSIDGNGRISYGPSNLSPPVAIKVTPSPWKPVLLVVSLFALLAMIVLFLYARLHRAWRARHRAAKSRS